MRVRRVTRRKTATRRAKAKPFKKGLQVKNQWKKRSGDKRTQEIFINYNDFARYRKKKISYNRFGAIFSVEYFKSPIDKKGSLLYRRGGSELRKVRM